MSSASASASRDDAREVRELMVKIHINASIALAKMRRHAESIAHCDAALERSAMAVKALYRRGVALEALGRDEAALESLRDALELSKDRSIREAFVRVRRRINEAPDAREREVSGAWCRQRRRRRRNGNRVSALARRSCVERPFLASAVAVAAIASLAVYFSGRRDGDEHRR